MQKNTAGKKTSPFTKQPHKTDRVRLITNVAVLSAIAIVLQYIVPFKVGGFLDIEFSDFPAILGTLAFGPLPGILIELIKNAVHCAVTTTGFVGELANFLINGVFVLVIGLVYKFHRTKAGAAIALLSGTIVMTAAAILSNRFLLLPLYLPEAIYWETIFTLITPFNIVRGLSLSLITFLSYKKLRLILK